MTYHGASTTSFCLAFAGILAFSACDGGDDDTGTGDTVGATSSMTATDDGMMDSSDGSADDSSGGSGSGLSHETDIQPIWDANCNMMGCHEAGGLFAPDLSPGAAYASIVGTMSPTASLNLVEAGSPEDSYLFRKLDGSWMMVDGGTGSMMPLSGTLSSDDLDTIEMWIADGAAE